MASVLERATRRLGYLQPSAKSKASFCSPPPPDFNVEGVAEHGDDGSSFLTHSPSTLNSGVRGWGSATAKTCFRFRRGLFRFLLTCAALPPSFVVPSLFVHLPPRPYGWFFRGVSFGGLIAPPLFSEGLPCPHGGPKSKGHRLLQFTRGGQHSVLVDRSGHGNSATLDWWGAPNLAPPTLRVPRIVGAYVKVWVQKVAKTCCFSTF